MTHEFSSEAAAEWNGLLNGTMEPVMRECARDDLADALYVLLVSEPEDSYDNLGEFRNLADQLRCAFDLCDRLVVATTPHTGRIIGVGGISRPANREGEYWHITFLSALGRWFEDCVIHKLLTELEGWSFSFPQCHGLTYRRTETDEAITRTSRLLDHNPQL